MSITISDPVLLAELSRLSGVVEVKDPQGCVIGLCPWKATGNCRLGKSPLLRTSNLLNYERTGQVDLSPTFSVTCRPGNEL